MDPLSTQTNQATVSNTVPHNAQKQTKKILPVINFFDIISPQDLFCPISLELMQVPLQLGCGHNFETAEISKWITQTKKKICPTCAQPIKGAIQNVFLKRIINELKEKNINPDDYIDITKTRSHDSSSISSSSGSPVITTIESWLPQVPENISQIVKEAIRIYKEGDKSSAVTMIMDLNSTNEVVINILDLLLDTPSDDAVIKQGKKRAREPENPTPNKKIHIDLEESNNSATSSYIQQPLPQPQLPPAPSRTTTTTTSDYDGRIGNYILNSQYPANTQPTGSAANSSYVNSSQHSNLPSSSSYTRGPDVDSTAYYQNIPYVASYSIPPSSSSNMNIPDPNYSNLTYINTASNQNYSFQPISNPPQSTMQQFVPQPSYDPSMNPSFNIPVTLNLNNNVPPLGSSMNSMFSAPSNAFRPNSLYFLNSNNASLPPPVQHIRPQGSYILNSRNGSFPAPIQLNGPQVQSNQGSYTPQNLLGLPQNLLGLPQT